MTTSGPVLGSGILDSYWLLCTVANSPATSTRPDNVVDCQPLGRVFFLLRRSDKADWLGRDFSPSWAIGQMIGSFTVLSPYVVLIERSHCIFHPRGGLHWECTWLIHSISFPPAHDLDRGGWLVLQKQGCAIFTAIFTPEAALIDGFHIMNATRQVVATNLAKLHTFKAKILCIVSLPMPDLFLVSVPARCLASPSQLCSVFLPDWHQTFLPLHFIALHFRPPRRPLLTHVTFLLPPSPKSVPLLSLT